MSQLSAVDQEGIPWIAYFCIHGNIWLLSEENCCFIVVVANGKVQRSVFLGNNMVDVSTSFDQHLHYFCVAALYCQDQGCPARQ